MAGWLELFFSSTVSLPPCLPRRRPLLFPSLHRESLTVSPPNRLVAESTDSLPSSPFLPSPLLYVLTTVTPLKSPLCALTASSRSPFNPSGRSIYILSANANIPPLLNPLHLGLALPYLPCLCTNGETLRSRVSVSNDLNPLSSPLQLIPPPAHTVLCAAIHPASVLAIGPGRHSLLVTCLSLLLHIPYITTLSRLSSPRTADQRLYTSQRLARSVEIRTGHTISRELKRRAHLYRLGCSQERTPKTISPESER
ncbi:hypothetical protein F5883DRAFT_34180 [Diaporthe sp. PMI_573]|nr:hypothetical protein F5883DRAFT_34180 [Diaporthaceae sp. PMI_573]